MVSNTMNSEDILAKREIRLLKNRESAERSRKNKENLIGALHDQLRELGVQIHNLEYSNWYLRCRLPEQCAGVPGVAPLYVSPIIEPAVFI